MEKKIMIILIVLAGVKAHCQNKFLLYQKFIMIIYLELLIMIIIILKIKKAQRKNMEKI